MDASGECSICLQSLKDETSLVRLTPCKHYFHRACFDEAVKIDFKTCPLCRNTFSKDSLDENTHPGVFTISPVIPFTNFIYTTTRPTYITNNTTIIFNEESTLYKTTYCINYIKITLDHIVLRLMNSIRQGELKIDLKKIHRLVLNHDKYETQGMSAIQISDIDDNPTIDHIEILVNSCLKEKKEIYNMIYAGMKSNGGVYTEKVTTKTQKYQYLYKLDLSGINFDI